VVPEELVNEQFRIYQEQISKAGMGIRRNEWFN
jgi:hypothetical protein